MELEIQTQQIDLDPDWRDLIERLAGRLQTRYPEMLRLHVTVRHGPHHRRGLEEVSLVANVSGVTLRADKQEEQVRTALRHFNEFLRLAPPGVPESEQVRQRIKLLKSGTF